MNLTQMLSELRSQRQQIEETILALERLATGQGKRRGRPPKWITRAQATDAAGRKKRVVSQATRQKMAAAQRRRWAARRKVA